MPVFLIICAYMAEIQEVKKALTRYGSETYT